MRRARAGGIERAEMARARCGGDERVGVIRRVRLVEFDVEDDAISGQKTSVGTSGERIGSWRV